MEKQGFKKTAIEERYKKVQFKRPYNTWCSYFVKRSKKKYSRLQGFNVDKDVGTR